MLKQVNTKDTNDAKEFIRLALCNREERNTYMDTKSRQHNHRNKPSMLFLSDPDSYSIQKNPLTSFHMVSMQ